TGSLGGAAMVRGVVRRQHDDAGLGGQRLHQAGCLEAVDAGQIDVHEHDVGPVRKRERLFGRLDAGDAAPGEPELEPGYDAAPQGLVIVDHQDGEGLVGAVAVDRGLHGVIPHSTEVSPLRMANFPTSHRPRLPSFCIRLERQVSTGFLDTQIRHAIFALRWPSATSCRISRSRRERLSTGDAVSNAGWNRSVILGLMNRLPTCTAWTAAATSSVAASFST